MKNETQIIQRIGMLQKEKLNIKENPFIVLAIEEKLKELRWCLED